MRHWTRLAAATAVVTALLSTSGFATTVLITDDTGYAGPALDLSGYATGSYNFTFGPVDIPGGITFTANPGGGGNSGLGSVIGQGFYGLGGNGSFGGNAVYIGVDSATGFAELTFSTLISSFGAFWNYAPGSGDNPIITALGDMGEILGEFDLSALAPISTPGGSNQFEFRGIESDAADIRTIRFGGSFILLAGTPDGGPVNPVPLPAGFPLLLIAMGGLAFLRRRAAA